MLPATASAPLAHRGLFRRAAFQPCMLPARPAVALIHKLRKQQQGLQDEQGKKSSTAAAAPARAAAAPATEPAPPGLGEAAAKALVRSARAATRYGWISFAVQLVLAIASTVILLFSVAFTPQTNAGSPLYLTLVGILTSYFSCFWNYRYTRVAKRLQRYLSILRSGAVPSKRIRKQDVVRTVFKGVLINLLGFGSTLLGIVTLVSMFSAQTISNATSSPYVAAVGDAYNPILVLDVFLVQAATNTLLGHFLSLVCSLWLLNIVGEGRGLRFQRFIGIQRLKRRVENNMVLSKGNALVFRIDAVPGASGSKRGPRDGGARSGGSAGSSSALPVVGAATTTAAVGFSAAARAMQAENARTSANSAGAGLSLAGEIMQSLRTSGGAASTAAATRPLLFPTQRSLQYLDGALPGDQGFDPLGLFDPDQGYTGVMSREYLRYSEIIHSRWAMLGVMGCLVPDAFASWGLLPEDSGGAMWLRDALPSIPLPLVAFTALSMGALEVRRFYDFVDPGGESAAAQSDRAAVILEAEEQVGLTSQATGDPAYPGGLTFNSLQLVRDASPSLFGYKEVELVNGRLAMMALVGFVVQGVVTGEGPYCALVNHLDDPVFHNVLFYIPWKTAF